MKPGTMADKNTNNSLTGITMFLALAYNEMCLCAFAGWESGGLGFFTSIYGFRFALSLWRITILVGS